MVVDASEISVDFNELSEREPIISTVHDGTRAAQCFLKHPDAAEPWIPEQRGHDVIELLFGA